MCRPQVWHGSCCVPIDIVRRKCIRKRKKTKENISGGKSERKKVLMLTPNTSWFTAHMIIMDG